MNSRFPPSKQIKPMHDMAERELAEPSSEGSNNALWRIPAWFSEHSQQDKFKAYHSELLKFNPKLNLISRNTEREADEVHFADCLMAGEILSGVDMGAKIFDFGAGNGFPGLILAIDNPERSFVLVESDSRKCEFMKHVSSVLQLKNVVVNNVRVESLQGETPVVGVVRGFASISKTLIACNRIFQKGGRIYHLKGSNWSSEVAELPSQLISSWKPELVGEYSLPVSQARRAVLCTIRR